MKKINPRKSFKNPSGVETSLEKLGQLIQQERKSRQLTQTMLGDLTGTSINFISQIEAGKNTAHIGKVLLVLQSLGIALQVVRGSKVMLLEPLLKKPVG